VSVLGLREMLRKLSDYHCSISPNSGQCATCCSPGLQGRSKSMPWPRGNHPCLP